jgi:nitrite reductase (NADH) small subunit
MISGVTETDLLLRTADREPRIVNLGSLEMVPLGEGREYEVGDQLIAVFRTRDQHLYAVQAHCPHRNGALADGIIGGGKVICPFHAFKFDLATGAPLGNDCQALKTFRVSVSDAGEMLLILDGADQD